MRSHQKEKGAGCVAAARLISYARKRVDGKASFSAAGFHSIPMNGKRNYILPPEIEEYRDLHWRREETLRIETAHQAEAFIERVGFTSCMTDSRQPGPSLYIAVCGRRDAVMPHNVQKDP